MNYSVQHRTSVESMNNPEYQFEENLQQISSTNNFYNSIDKKEFPFFDTKIKESPAIITKNSFHND